VSGDKKFEKDIGDGDKNSVLVSILGIAKGNGSRRDEGQGESAPNTRARKKNSRKGIGSQVYKEQG